MSPLTKRDVVFVVHTMDSAPSGDDAMEPSVIDVHEGAWAVIIGTTAKAIGWVDTHATFDGLTYRDRFVEPLLPPTEAQLVAEYEQGQVFSPALMSSYERGQRDMLNILLTPNKAAADAVAAIMDTDPATNPDGKLSFETVCWIAEIAEQIGLKPKDEVAA